MTETTTPTDEVADQSSSDIRDESLLETESEQDSAVERQEDTDSSESEGSDSEQSSSQDGSSDEDKGLAKFAKSQGIDDLSTLTEREKSLLKTAHDNIREKRKQMQEEADQRKISDEVQELTKPGEDDDQSEVLMKRMARFEAKESLNEFWSQHQDERKYEAKMAEILAEEKKNFGADAAWRLSQNLPRLLREAKFADGAFDSDAARDAGRREERERLRKAQEGSADSAHATQGTAKGSGKLTRESIEAMTDEQYAEHREEIDKAIARGDLY